MPDTDRPHIICLGPYGSGTNFLSITLEDSGVLVSNGPRKNYWNRANKTVFKHYVIEADSLALLTLPENYHFVCVLKHPLHWFKSVRDMIGAGMIMPQLKDVPFSEIIRQSGSMVGVKRELPGLTAEEAARKRFYYKNLPDLWNSYVKGYAKYLPINSFLVSYEKLLFKSEQTFGFLVEAFGGNRSEVKIHRDRRFQDTHNQGIGRNFAEARAHYSLPDSRYSGYSDDDLEFIKVNIKPAYLKLFGYAKDL